MRFSLRTKSTRVWRKYLARNLKGTMYVPADATVYAAANTTAQISAADVEARVVHATELLGKDPSNVQTRVGVYSAQYNYSKYIRVDNRLEYAKYLGYLDARELYPDFVPKGFREFAVDLLDGKVVRPYSNARYD